MSRGLGDVYKRQITTKHTFSLSASGIISRIEHMLGDRLSLNRFQKIDIIQNIFSNYKKIKLETEGKLGNSQIYGN